MYEQTLILDLGNVLFHWSTQTLIALPPTHLHSVLLSPSWGAHERGELTQEQAIDRIDIKAVKKSMKGKLKVYAMTNISDVDFALLKATLEDWDLFDGVFTSFGAGMRKPELEFYRKVLKETGALPENSIFVDDKIDNVIVARTFGLTGIVFESANGLIRTQHNLYFDQITRGQAYLKENAGNHKSQIENGPEFEDAFSQFLIYEITNSPALIQLHDSKTTIQLGKVNPIAKFQSEARVWNYFISPPVGTTKNFPDDVDTTSCSLLALSPPKTSADAILDAILANRNDEGLVQTYFDPSRPRVDPVVLANVVRAFYKYDRGDEVEKSFDWVRSTLLHRGYVNGTLHYYSAESFLFFVSMLVADNKHHTEIEALEEPLMKRLTERVGHRDDSLAVAMRILACQAELQETDGGWEIGWVCRYGRSRKRIGNRGVVTAYAVKGLEGDRKPTSVDI
ncbi:HAD-like domain-containing protein [Lophiotrema nucula]|uniref:HAD-like domain-containing protein n=1 Tax=Lophiotrema nucula TaxID=690887 RepID=A0A6A5YHL5_9PLEO|nr:HAD-like domain-containing protein [Lophiotrema nucula]